MIDSGASGFHKRLLFITSMSSHFKVVIYINYLLSYNVLDALYEKPTGDLLCVHLTPLHSNIAMYLIYLIPTVYIKCVVQEACLDAVYYAPCKVSDFPSRMGGHPSTSFPGVHMLYWFIHVCCACLRQLLFITRGFCPSL